MTTPKKLSVLLFVALAAPSLLAITATKDYVDRRDNIVSNALATAISSETTRATKAESEIKSLADTHISDTNNPHGVTALQVGALPAVYSNNQYNVTNDVNLNMPT